MSGALWCDKGGHAFSDTDKSAKKMVFTEQVTPSDGVSRPVETRQDICGPCSAEVMFVGRELPADAGG